MNALIEQRLVAALHSGDLRWTPNRVRDVDYVTALGMTGIRQPLAAKLYRLVHTQDRAAYFEVLPEMMLRLVEVAIDGGWRVTPSETAALSRQALDHLIKPACPVCKGRAYAEIAGTGRLSAQACAACHGSGQRVLTDVRLAALVRSVEGFEAVIAGGVGRRLYGRRG